MSLKSSTKTSTKKILLKKLSLMACLVGLFASNSQAVPFVTFTRDIASLPGLNSGSTISQLYDRSWDNGDAITHDPVLGRAMQNLVASGVIGADLLGISAINGDEIQQVILAGELTGDPSLNFLFARNETTGVLTQLSNGSDTAGATVTPNLAAGNYSLELFSNGEVLSSLDARNANNRVQAIGMQVILSGFFFPGTSIALTAGDMLVFFEDRNGNLSPFGLAGNSDYDYHDSIFLFRPVPEPATMLLLGSSLVFLARRKRKAS